MKLSLNGALTIGTLDGANIEIMQEVGNDNIFIFGLNADEVLNLKKNNYHPREFYEKNPELKRVINMIAHNYFSRFENGIFQPIVDSLLNVDYYCVLADYESYVKTQEQVSNLYLNKEMWTKKSILNSARMGKFSSDRAIKEYAKLIWNVKPIKINI
jgi:starch phosphorylase